MAAPSIIVFPCSVDDTVYFIADNVPQSGTVVLCFVRESRPYYRIEYMNESGSLVVIERSIDSSWLYPVSNPGDLYDNFCTVAEALS